MPAPIIPQNQWETDFEGPLPGEPGLAGAFRTLIQRILNRTERLKNRLGAILGLPWDATPPDTLTGLAGRVSTLEGDQGGTTLSAHRSAATLDHPDGSVTAAKLSDGAVTTPKIANQAVTADKLAPGSVVGHLGYTPVNKAGDTMTGPIKINNERLFHVYVNQGNSINTRFYYLGRIFNNDGILKLNGIMGGHAISHGRANINLQLAFRDGFRADGYIMGTVNTANLLVKDGRDGWAYVYLVTNQWALVNLELSTAGTAEIYYNGTYSTDEPDGTTIYYLGNDFFNNIHPNTLKLNDGVLQVRYNHQNRFVISEYAPQGINLSPGGITDLAIARINVPAERSLYIRRVRYRLLDPLRVRIDTSQTVWIASNADMDADVNFAIFAGSGTTDLSIRVTNVGSSNQTLFFAQGVWVEFEIR